MDALGERGALDQLGGVIEVIRHLDGEADDFAAIEIEDQVEVEPLADHVRWQIGQVSAPDLAGAGSEVRGGRPGGRCRCLGSAPMAAWPGFTQDAVEG